MFDIAWSELLLIAVVALIFIGPKELPQVLHTLGRMVAKLRRSADDFRRQFEDSVREAGYEDLHKNIQEFRSLHPASQLKDSIARAINQEYAKPAASVEQPPAQQTIAESPAPQAGTHAEAQQVLPGSSQQAPAEDGSVALFEKPAAQEAQPLGASEPKAPAGDPAKDRVAPAA